MMKVEGPVAEAALFGEDALVLGTGDATPWADADLDTAAEADGR
ncbi:MAG: hypothetical protein U0531_17805 [Dehalococcoidia bacterium]